MNKQKNSEFENPKNPDTKKKSKSGKGKNLQDDKFEKTLRNILVGGALTTLAVSGIVDQVYYKPLAKEYSNILGIFYLKDILGFEDGDFSLPDKNGKGKIFLKNKIIEKNLKLQKDIKIQKFENQGGKIDIIFSKDKDTYHIKIENNSYQILSQ